MKKLNKLVTESIKTSNLIKRHHKKYQIPGLYEQCKNIQKILDEDDELKNQFTIKDISHFFTGFHMFSKSIFKMNEEELEKSLKEYFYSKSKIRYYYFRVDMEYRVARNFRIGNGMILHFSSLPKKVKERLEDGYSHEYNRDYFANQTPENYKKLRSDDDHYMKIKIISKGSDNATQKAINSFNFNKSIFEFFTLTNFSEESDTSAVYISIDENDDLGIQTFGSVDERRIHQKQFLVKFIAKINQILDKDKSKRNDIEDKILLAVNIVGTHDSNSNVNVRFLFCLVAMEILLVGNPDRGITHRLIERMAFLLGDDEDWLNYYRVAILEKTKSNRKITKNYIDRHLKNSRMKLASTISKAYTKRSNIAHDAESNISEQDYYLVKLLLVKLVIKMFELLDQGIKCIDKNQKYPENKSLWHLINQLKFE